MKILILALTLVLTACGGDNSGQTAKKSGHHLSEQYFSELPSVKAYAIQTSPELAQLQGLELVRALRNLVHQNVSFHANTDQNRFSTNHPMENLRLVMEDQTYSHWCGGSAYTYASLLRAFGFEAEMIQLVGLGGENHVANEVFIDGKWIAQDATFNVEFVDQKGSLINFTELKAQVDSGHQINYVFEDFPLVRDVYTYYVPYADHLNEIYPTGY